MKILVVTTYGVNRFFRNWPEALLTKALARRGHQVTALTYYDAKSREQNPRDEQIEGVHVKRIATHGWYSRELAHTLAQLPQPDLLHVFHLRNYLAFQSAWQMRRSGVPLVVTPIGPLHDPFLVLDRDRPLDAPPRWSNLILSRRTLLSRIAGDGRVKRHLENYLMHWPLRHADEVIACSDHERKLWKRIQVESETIPLWIDESFIRAHSGEKYPKQFGPPTILFVAQLKYRKGFDVLARSMASVTARFPGATFVFVSHSPIHRRELEEIAKETGTLGNLKIIERATEEDKVQLYNAADALVFPSRYEGFGLPLLEAMAAGCPVVCSNIPVVDEIVTDGENGLLVPRDDPTALSAAIVRLLEDKALRMRLITRGFETLKRFDEEALVTHVEAVYRQVISREAHNLSIDRDARDLRSEA